MRKVTEKVISAFLERKHISCGNSHTDGNALFLHGNKIAEFRGETVWATLCGWNTPTTRERLNAIPGFRFTQKNFEPFLNGFKISAQEWYPESYLPV